MQNCPHCHQSINSKAVKCPYCGTVLKAYGHPGITLHRASKDNFLCETCTYHADDTCNFPQRPHAKECTLYQDISQPQLDRNPIYIPRSSLLQSIKFWCQRNPALIGLFVLIAVSLLLAVISM
ncbi:zinc ribbon domain-containing protein [Limnofasciculus baicalensis]|uniref:Zinc ribbon domain-containing protein n=1 Tax=Limnofasciculus baicalensis BBK-W-15 TaxID=2699891 RepID=A0AAE3GSY4_9CYAN|nr:zinc ribbon domain-containing protein [Limnofasciculus baicalensis]MCP2730175.1 zinc ribbon domain-containing protein [Limnofasciculus baicalensis BBK-W-15]